MSLPLPLIAVRSSAGVQLNICSEKSHAKLPTFEQEKSRSCRCMAMSENGSLFAWTNGETVNVVSLPECVLLLQLPRPKTYCLEFSPLGTILATWELYSANKENPHLSANLRLWDVKTGTCLKELVQKKQSNWLPEWSDDEVICARSSNNEVHFFENGNFSSISKKIHTCKILSFSLAFGPPPYHIAGYIPGVSGQPSFVRLFRFPNFDGNNAIVASKSFFRADRVDMKWNKKGTSLLILTITDVDKTGASYYGEQKLHFMATNGDSNAVQLAKNGPVYTAEWNPNSTEFCVVYGFMPAQATLFNLKCEVIFDFATGPRNLAYYNCFGNMLLLAGFGNLRGNVEIWDLNRRRQIKKIEASDSTQLEWFSDGEHFLTATTAPRLRVGNGYKLWHYTGKLVLEHTWDDEEELYDVTWQPHSLGTFPQNKIHYAAIPQKASEPAQNVYRPPAARYQPSAVKPLAQTQDAVAMSKAALKNKKKRDAKKSKKENETLESKSSESVSSASTVGVGDLDKDKKLRNLQKKLEQIEKLKAQVEEGRQLELNQLEKLKREKDLLQELQDLQV